MGARLVTRPFSLNAENTVMPQSSQNVVLQTAARAVSSDRFDSHPLWSPDGTRISYTERSREFFSGKLKVLGFDQKSGNPIEPARDLYIASNDPGGAWAINTAAWSPDSKTLAVVLQQTHWDKIWLIPAIGGKPLQLAFGSGEDEQPLYSPDGKWIVFDSNRGVMRVTHLLLLIVIFFVTSVVVW